MTTGLPRSDMSVVASSTSQKALMGSLLGSQSRLAITTAVVSNELPVGRRYYCQTAEADFIIN